MRARYHVYLGRYLKDVDIEVETLVDLARTHVRPAAIQHQSLLAHLRESSDRLEVLVADSLWPLPKYTEMSF